MGDLLESFEYALFFSQFPLYGEAPSVSCFSSNIPSLRPRHREVQLRECMGRAKIALDQAINKTLRFKSLSISKKIVLILLALWFPTGGDFTPLSREYLGTSGGIFGCYNWVGEVTIWCY